MRGRSLWFPVFAVIVGSLVPLVSDAQPRTDAPLLTTIKAIRSLSQDQSARAYPVRVRGIVTHIDEAADFSLFIHDGELGQFVARPTHPAALAAYRELKRGDLVEVEGRTVRGGFAPNVDPAVIRRLGQAALPRPKNVPFAAMLTGRHDCDYVEVTGVVQRAWRAADPQMHTLFMDVAFEEGVVRAAFWDFSQLPNRILRTFCVKSATNGNFAATSSAKVQTTPFGSCPPPLVASVAADELWRGLAEARA